MPRVACSGQSLRLYRRLSMDSRARSKMGRPACRSNRSAWLSPVLPADTRPQHHCGSQRCTPVALVALPACNAGGCLHRLGLPRNQPASDPPGRPFRVNGSFGLRLLEPLPAGAQVPEPRRRWLGWTAGSGSETSGSSSTTGSSSTSTGAVTSFWAIYVGQLQVATALSVANGSQEIS